MNVTQRVLVGIALLLLVATVTFVTSYTTQFDPLPEVPHLPPPSMQTTSPG